MAEPVAPTAAWMPGPQAPFAPGPPFVGQPYPPAYPAPYPFAPVAKEPWFNPAKRTSIVIAAIVLALVLLGGGIVIGAASVNHRDRTVVRYGPQDAQRVGPANGARARLGRPGAGFGHNGQLAPVPSASATPTTS
jgi:hypothetical protein